MLQLIPIEKNSPSPEFLQVHVNMHLGNPSFIQPLNKDIEAVFDPGKNKSFKRGDCQRWILKDEQGNLLGRIAAFVQSRYKNKGDDIPVGGIGFFDCINDQVAANTLFDAAKNWLQERKMEAMDGPINFGERDKWWGLLVEGFHPPPYGLNYHPPYYRKLFENYGFRVFYEQICWKLQVSGNGHQLLPKFYKAHQKFAPDNDFEVRQVKKNKLDQFARDFCTVYNDAWAKHEGNKEMSEIQAIKLFRSMKPILDESLAWFTYFRNKPVAMWINIPDLNQIFRHFNGKLHIWNKFRFMYHLRNGACNRFIGIIYGIVPEFQGSGIDYYMIVEAEKVIKAKGRYRELELMWQGDFNQKMLGISRNLGAEESRRLITWRYLFDRNKPFVRHPFIS
ncbi:hypothetical protein [Flavihumibacter fluvii]|uniref:hypothetical protein n=1 Tax=Flavihumibacter fluvii TaxID=2838157 RepID=UPI001BDEAF3F|nr:hypothetical protein [Flavihumibacter fluvii]ULQ52614.1 hypothetical protein KJS93_21230 [Flavihumibacter fluvii]